MMMIEGSIAYPAAVVLWLLGVIAVVVYKVTRA